MLGHTPLIAMRTKGIKPAAVFVSDEITQIVRDWHSPVTLSGLPMAMHTPHIAVEPKDAISRLDWRFLFGLTVFAYSDNEKTAQALFAACKKAGAAVVVACHTHAKRNDETPQWMEMHCA
jgi:hypothetical protein